MSPQSGQSTESKKAWRQGLLFIMVALGLVGMALVFLVLTGIIAEPETVIEAIIRALSGR